MCFGGIDVYTRRYMDGYTTSPRWRLCEPARILGEFWDRTRPQDPRRVGNYLGIFDIAKNNESLQDVQHHTHGGIQTQPISFAFQSLFMFN